MLQARGLKQTGKGFSTGFKDDLVQGVGNVKKVIDFVAGVIAKVTAIVNLNGIAVFAKAHMGATSGVVVR